MVKSGKNSQTGGMGGRVPDLGKIPTFSRFFLGQRPIVNLLQLGEIIGHGGWLIGPKVFRPKAYTASKVCEFIIRHRSEH